MKFLKIVILIFLVNFINFNAFSEQSAEDIIKKRKSLFSENYKTAKRADILSKDLEFEDATKFMIKMSENYLELLALFPENTKEGFGTQSLPSIWENKDEFNALMQKASDDMIKLAKAIETAEDLRAVQKKLMWSNCSACHSKFRAPH